MAFRPDILKDGHFTSTVDYILWKHLNIQLPEGICCFRLCPDPNWIAIFHYCVISECALLGSDPGSKSTLKQMFY